MNAPRAGSGAPVATAERPSPDEATRARLAAIVTSCPDPIIGETLDGIITDWNPAAERVYGYSAAEAIGQHLALLSPPDRGDEIATLLDRVRRGATIEAFESVRRAKDGRLVDVSLTVFPIWNDRGQLIGASATTRDISDRKAAEAALAAAHQQTRDVLARISDGFVALDGEWRFTYVNEVAERLLQRPRAELLGENIWQVLSDAVETPLYAACLQAAADGRAASVEFAYPALDAWFGARIDPSPAGLTIFFRDITAKRLLTQELHASEARFQTLVEQLPGVVYRQAADEQDTPLYCSPYIETLLGIHPREVVGPPPRYWLDDVHPDDQPWVDDLNCRTMAAGEEFRAEYRMRRRDGSYVWVRDNCVPIYDANGAIVAWQGILLDISDRIAAEEARARLAAIIEGAEDAIVGRTLDGTITSWNGGAERLYGIPAEAMIGQQFTLLLPEEDRPDGPLPEEEFGTEPIRFEARRRRSDGTVIDVALSLSPIYDRRGVVVGVSTITRDITDRKRAEAELQAALEGAEAATEAKSRFLAILSHELRTPLQAVLGYADFLLNASASPLATEQREDIGYIYNGATRMVTLIEQMLDLSRMEAGGLTLHINPLDLGETIEHVRQDIAPQADGKGLALEISIAPDLPPVSGDANRLRQILLNLAGNAVKFTERGSVRISARPAADGGVDLAVRDTGIGIEPDAVGRIFEEFQQVDNPLTRHYGGAGLGLAISQRLAEQMGGEIRVTSQPSSGSTFTLHLPNGGDRVMGL